MLPRAVPRMPTVCKKFLPKGPRADSVLGIRTAADGLALHVPKTPTPRKAAGSVNVVALGFLP